MRTDHHMRGRKLLFCSLLLAMGFLTVKMPALAAGFLMTPSPEEAFGDSDTNGRLVRYEYERYRQRLDSIDTRSEIEENGFVVMEEQVFPVILENFGEVFFVPALDDRYHRLALFFTDADEKVVYKTDQLEANFMNRGQITQPVREIAAVSFQDLNGDGMTDIELIAACVNDTGSYANKRYQIGDVLFGSEKGFFRDWRISDKINRFGMNKSIDCITAYVRDQKSTEYLYTATTLEELQQNGFAIIPEQSYTREFEKMGKLLVAPGSALIADFEVFMIYLADGQGNIVWSFQPMGDHDNLYALRGINCRDIDGDGLKDIIVLARYSDALDAGEQQIVSDYAIYYQRTGGFSEDEEFKKRFVCDENTKMEDLVKAARAYWGWQAEE
ncbi:MAG: VCBS repeat-containing protein [Eubacteriales bacterium]|nr:VCBS repeat-containing protein [Eubacteriales bacterium]